MTCNPCTTCGSTTRCGCGCAPVRVGQQVTVDSIGGGGCCGPVPASPTPYYQCAPASPQSHTSKIIIEQFYADVKVANSWNVPGCGEEASLVIPGLKSINVGSYLWNATYGYFETTGFDEGTSTVTVVNNCNDGNANAGTNVPECTLFTVTDPPFDNPETGDTCVAVDFTAPEDGDCIDITLTNTNGITAADTVQIGSGFYYVNEVKPNNIINICNNDNQGITPGTPVIAKDVNGLYQYCLSVIAANPCERDQVYTGRVLVCNDDRTQSPITGNNAGWNLTLVDAADGSAEYRPTGLPSQCTKLANALNIVNGDATYTLVVDSTTGFAIGDKLEINGRADRATITGIPDSTNLNVTIDPVPSASTTYPIGTFVCEIGCCERLAEIIPCQKAVVLGDIPLQYFSIPLDFGDYVCLAYNATINDEIRYIEVPSDCEPDATYYVKAVASVGVLPSHDAGTVMHEIEVLWDNTPLPRQNGKMVWTDYGEGYYENDGSTCPPSPDLYPPCDDYGIWCNEEMQAALGYMMYHQNDINALVTDVPAGTIMALRMDYKSLIPGTLGPTFFDGVQFVISGVVELYKQS